LLFLLSIARPPRSTLFPNDALPICAERVPVGSRLPPNPLGVYDMADNGMEWVSDWYSDTWSRNNQNMTNPTGPVDGTEKTLRNMDFSFSRVGMPETVPTLHSADRLHLGEFTFRCALQRPTPLNTTGGKHAD